MSTSDLDLAAGFPTPSHEDWLALVDQALGGRPFGKALLSENYDGLVIKPLYTRDDADGSGDPAGFPGFAPYTRGAQAVRGGWDLRQRHDHPDPREANRQILKDLERGVTSVLIAVDPDGRDGVVVRSKIDLEEALAGVQMDLALVALDAGGHTPAAAAMLMTLWAERGLAAEAARGAFNADPLAALAVNGALSGSLKAAMTQLGALAAWAARDYPKVTAVGVSTRAYSSAGSSEGQEIAAALATGVAYLRALEAAGLELKAAARQIAFTATATADVFPTIAKLRALRRAWMRVLEACGIDDPPAMRLAAETAPRIYTRRDPWVNILRATIACFAAGVSGVDAVTVRCHDSAVDVSGGFARRIARNVQIILAEESHITRVMDPAGGAWAIEDLTSSLAAEGWRLFQEIEAEGGMAQSLIDGRFQNRIAAVWQAMAHNIARRKDAITGVSEFPDLDEKPVDAAAVDVDAIIARAQGRVSQAAPSGAGIAEMVEAAERGAPIIALTETVAGSPARAPALPRHRLAEAFEALRDASDRHKNKTGARPSVFLANLGPLAAHTARATFAKSAFEAGGIAAIASDGLDGGEAAARAFKKSGAAIACLCGSDEGYANIATEVARALREAGAKALWLAGRPGEMEGALKAAGCERFVYLGCDLLAELHAAYEDLGVALEEG